MFVGLFIYSVSFAILDNKQEQETTSTAPNPPSFQTRTTSPVPPRPIISFSLATPKFLMDQSQVESASRSCNTICNPQKSDFHLTVKLKAFKLSICLEKEAFTPKNLPWDARAKTRRGKRIIRIKTSRSDQQRDKTESDFGSKIAVIPRCRRMLNRLRWKCLLHNANCLMIIGKFQ